MSVFTDTMLYRLIQKVIEECFYGHQVDYVVQTYANGDTTGDQ